MMLTPELSGITAKRPPAGDSDWLPLYIHVEETANILCLLAKEWLADHIKQFLFGGIEAIDKKLLTFIGLSHDTGKITAAFQKRIKPVRHDDRIAEAIMSVRDGDMKYTPHAYAGEAILLKYGCKPGIAAVVGGHHGKPCGVDDIDPASQLDIYPKNFWGNKRQIFEDMWADWLEYSLDRSGYGDIGELPDITVPQQIILCGLLIMADWIASNTSYFPLIPAEETGVGTDIEALADAAWKKLNLTIPWYANCLSGMNEGDFESEFKFTPNNVQRDVLSMLNGAAEPGMLIIEAPMGVGKTEAALAAAEIMASKNGCGGVFFGLPTQATANGLFGRLEEWARYQSQDALQSIRLAHGAAELNENYRALFEGESYSGDEESGLIVHSWFSGRKQAMLADFVIGTVDQLLLSALKQKHVMLRHLGIIGKVVVVDECHAYDAYMSRYLERVMTWLGEYRTPVIILSATLTVSRRKSLIAAYMKGRGSFIGDDGLIDGLNYPLITMTDGDKIVCRVPETETKKRDVEIMRITPDNLVGYLKENMRCGGCAGIIVNTVKQAQDTALILRSEMPSFEVNLFHSRYVAADRSINENELMRRIGKGSTAADRDGLIVVGTQVLEQSLDIDFDFLITGLCPMDLLIQRIGRLHRHSRRRPKALEKAVCGIIDTGDDTFDSGSKAVYGEWLLMRTRSLLTDKITLPDDIPLLINAAYEAPDDAASRDERAYDKYINGIAIMRSRADCFLLSAPARGRRSKTIHRLLDNSAKDDATAIASVRDGDPSFDVLLMKTVGGDAAAYVSCDMSGITVSVSNTPSQGEAIAILRQRIKLPSQFCYPSEIDGTIGELERRMLAIAPEWRHNKTLKGELILFLDENGDTTLRNKRLNYSGDMGLIIKEG